MGIFSNLKNARGSLGGNYFAPGNFVIEVQRVKSGTTRKNVGMIAIETKIIESDSDKLKPGALATQLLTADKDAAAGNYADFLRMAYWQLGKNTGTAVPADPAEIELSDEMGEVPCGEDQIFAGLQLGLNCFNKKTQKGGDFTRHIWMPVEQARANIKTAKAQPPAPSPSQPAA